jgi:hypothetical protein
MSWLLNGGILIVSLFVFVPLAEAQPDEILDVMDRLLGCTLDEAEEVCAGRVYPRWQAPTFDPAVESFWGCHASPDQSLRLVPAETGVIVRVRALIQFRYMSEAIHSFTQYDQVWRDRADRVDIASERFDNPDYSDRLARWRCAERTYGLTIRFNPRLIVEAALELSLPKAPHVQKIRRLQRFRRSADPVAHKQPHYYGRFP